MNARLQSIFSQNERLSQAASSIILAGMVFCSGLILDAFAARLAPAWPRELLPWLAGLAAIEAIYSENFVHTWPELSWRRMSYRVSEALVIAFSVKISLFGQAGMAAFLAEIAAYNLDFLSSFFSGSFSALLFFVFILWGFSTRIAHQLIEMGGDRNILEYGARPDFFTDRNSVRRQLAGTVLFFGAVLVVLATLTRSDLELVWGSLAPVEASAAAVVVYFCLSLLLISQGQFAVMRARWGWARTPIAAEISKSWLKYTGLFMVGILAAVLILPTGYSLDFLASFGIFFRLLIALVAFLLFLLSLPLILLVAALTGEEPREFENPLAEFMQTPALLPDSAASGIEPVAWIELARSLVFWISFLLVVAFAFFQFIRYNEPLWRQLMAIRVWRLAYGLWTRLQRWLFGVGQDMSQLVEGGRRRLRQIRSDRSVGSGWNFGGLVRRTPRERVIFLYRSMVRRAGERQVARRSYDTPSEYAEVLAKAFPELAPEIGDLTAVFEAARYSRRPVSGRDAAQAGAIWNRIRGKFRHRG